MLALACQIGLVNCALSFQCTYIPSRMIYNWKNKLWLLRDVKVGSIFIRNKASELWFELYECIFWIVLFCVNFQCYHRFINIIRANTKSKKNAI